MSMSANVEVHVTVLAHVFGPKEDGYRVLQAMDPEGQKFTLSGKVFPECMEDGDEIVVTGAWKSTRHGSTLQAQSARMALPQTTEGIRIWLTNSKVPGIGKARAQQLVDVFGAETISKIISLDKRAAKIIGKKAIGPAAEYLAEKTREAELGIMLSEYGIGSSIQAKILRKYADNAPQIVKEKPYRLILDIKGVAFQTADQIARSSGISATDPERIRAGILEVLRVAMLDGHTALYHGQLVDRVDRLLYVDRELIEAQLKEMAKTHLKSVELEHEKGWTTLRLDDAEERIARSVMAKLQQPGLFSEDDALSAAEEAQHELGVTLNREQLKAVITALTSPISILTGGPGTGKTMTLRVLIAAWKMLARGDFKLGSKEFKITAPTGRAAKHAGSVTGVEGKTIHRLLEFDPESNGFLRGPSNPIEAGFIAVDECSMPDVSIMRDLSGAWGEANILFVGDIDQLPSVGPGAVLRDLIESGKVPYTRLEEIYRQAKGSQIAIGATQVRKGQMPEMSAPGKSDLVFIDLERNEDIAARVMDIYTRTMPAYLADRGMDPGSIQILTPGKKSVVGTVALNTAIQSVLHEGRPGGARVNLSDGMIGKPGDPVIQLENDYDRNVFNGDTGRIVEIEVDEASKPSKTHIDFSGRMLSFEGQMLSNLSLAYAMTIHKSQGSEYEVVIILVSDAHYMLNRRPLIYTGMTRAKRICVFVGQKRTMARAISIEDTVSRVTTLKQRIIEKCGS